MTPSTGPVVRDGAEGAAWNTFGVGENSEQVASLFQRRVRSTLSGSEIYGLCSERSKLDVTSAIATRRWRQSLRGAGPQRFVPGDLVGIRGYTARDAVMRARMFSAAERYGTATEEVVVAEGLMLLDAAAALYSAVPHFLDADAAEALLDADAPDDTIVADLRMPYPSALIMFSEARRLPDRLHAFPDELAEFELELNASTEAAWSQEIQRLDAEGTDDNSYRVAVLEMAQAKAAGGGPSTAYQRFRGRLEGLILFAGADGLGVAPSVMWLVQSEPLPADNPSSLPVEMRQTRRIVPGWLPWSSATSAVLNLACAVAWAEWVEPEPPAGVPPVGSTEFAKAIRHNKVRRAEEAGAVAGVRVIDLRKTEKRSRVEESTGRSTATHLRRGHWRSTRIATRDEHGVIVGDVHGTHGADWHYEGRWVAPTVVNAGGRADGRTPVYRVDS